MSKDILLEEPPKADCRESTEKPSQFVDLFLPRRKKAIEVLPIIFFIHEGFWKSEMISTLGIDDTPQKNSKSQW